MSSQVMTREEAIGHLRVIITYAENDGYTELAIEALKMAIQALEQESVLDKIKNEFIDRYPRNYANDFELGGRSCVFSLNEILRIFHKYKTESEEV